MLQRAVRPKIFEEEKKNYKLVPPDLPGLFNDAQTVIEFLLTRSEAIPIDKEIAFQKIGQACKQLMQHMDKHPELMIFVGLGFSLVMWKGLETDTDEVQQLKRQYEALIKKPHTHFAEKEHYYDYIFGRSAEIRSSIAILKQRQVTAGVLKIFSSGVFLTIGCTIANQVIKESMYIFSIFNAILSTGHYFNYVELNDLYNELKKFDYIV